MLGLAFVLFCLWLLGLFMRVGGFLVHLLIITAVVLYIVDFVINRGK